MGAARVVLVRLCLACCASRSSLLALAIHSATACARSYCSVLVPSPTSSHSHRPLYQHAHNPYSPYHVALPNSLRQTIGNPPADAPPGALLPNAPGPLDPLVDDMNELTLNRQQQLRARLDADSRGHESIYGGLPANDPTMRDKNMKGSMQTSPTDAAAVGGPVAPPAMAPSTAAMAKAA